MQTAVPAPAGARPRSRRARRWGGALLVAAIVVLAAAGLLLVARAGRPDPAAGAVPLRRPDDASLLLVTIDTTRADRLEPYGGPAGSTPTLARMAEEGVTFERAYSVAPITLVAHSSVLTGLYPPEHGVRNNGIHRLEAEVETLAERLRDNGFRTAAFVSAAVLEDQYGLDQGFEVYDDDLSAGRERHPRMVPDRPAEATVAAAADWLASLDDGERFFLWVHLYDPHAPYSPPPPWRDDHRDDLYQGEIAYLDHWLGKLFAHPRLRTGDLVTAVVGDHGESLGEHGEQTHALLAYDATLHVPLFLRWPGAPRGRRVAPAVSQVDLAPTLLDLAGVDPPVHAAGRSLVPLVAGAATPPRGLYSETYLPFYTYGWAKLRVWRQGLAKYVDAPTPELFDLSRDPRELTNLHDSEPGLAHDLARDLGEFLEEVGGGEAEAEMALDSESVEKLRALGYLAVGSSPSAAARADRDRPDPKEVIDLHTGLQKARRLADDGLHEPAVAELERVLRRDPGNLAALIDLAASQAGLGALDAAVATVERALALDPDYPRLYLQLAAIELRRGDRARAAELADRALELDPRLPEAWIQKAQIAARSRQEGAAAAAVEEALATVGEHPRLLAVAAQLVDLPAGDLDRAEERARRALDLDPFLPAAWRLLGEVQERRGRDEEAAASYREGLRRRPDDAELHGRLGMLLARGGGSPAAPGHLREAIRLRAEPDPELHVALGAWLAGQGDLAAAEAEYRRVLDGRPRHPGARNNLAIVLSQTGRRAEAREMLEALTAERPRLADPWNNLAALAVDRGDWPEAERAARRSLELDRAAAPTWNNLGIARDEQGDAAGAEAAYRRALALDPGYWQARLNLGIVLARTGRAEEAREAFASVVAAVPAQPDAHRELGALYAGPLADPGKARLHWNAFLRHAPVHPDAALVRRRLAELPP